MERYHSVCPVAAWWPKAFCFSVEGRHINQVIFLRVLLEWSPPLGIAASPFEVWSHFEHLFLSFFTSNSWIHKASSWLKWMGITCPVERFDRSLELEKDGSVFMQLYFIFTEYTSYMFRVLSITHGTVVKLVQAARSQWKGTSLPFLSTAVLCSWKAAQCWLIHEAHWGSCLKMTNGWWCPPLLLTSIILSLRPIPWIWRESWEWSRKVSM